MFVAQLRITPAAKLNPAIIPKQVHTGPLVVHDLVAKHRTNPMIVQKTIAVAAKIVRFWFRGAVANTSPAKNKDTIDAMMTK